MDAKQHVVGYQFGWQQPDGERVDTTQNNHRLLAIVAEQLTEPTSGLCFLDTCSSSLLSESLQTMTPANTVLVMRSELLQDNASVTLLLALHKHGFGLAVRGATLDFMRQNEILLPRIGYFLMDSADPQFTDVVKLISYRYPLSHVVIEQISSWTEFNAFAEQNGLCIFENLCNLPRAYQPSIKLSSGTQQILRLLQMVQENVDIRELEKVLQTDSTLSFKLLRYINSAGFGLTVEIQSLRQAVAMLGYMPLFRWLILMLARTSNDGFSPALLELSIIRGRFVELLARDFLSKSEAENLFVVGMFSQLDHLLGIPIEQVLQEVELSESVNQALISRGGVYGPFLTLAEAIERQNGAAANIAVPLLVTAEQVNQAHLSALVWARNLKL